MRAGGSPRTSLAVCRPANQLLAAQRVVGARAGGEDWRVRRGQGGRCEGGCDWAGEGRRMEGAVAHFFSPMARARDEEQKCLHLEHTALGESGVGVEAPACRSQPQTRPALRGCASGGGRELDPCQCPGIEDVQVIERSCRRVRFRVKSDGAEPLKAARHVLCCRCRCGRLNELRNPIFPRVHACLSFHDH
jgi:hypothetical protein